MTTQEKINNVVSYLPVVGLLALIATLPFHYGSAQRIALYWLAAAYPIDYIVNRRWQGRHWSHRNWVYVAFIAFFCLIPVWQIFDPLYTPHFAFTIEHYLPFLVIGICGIVGFTDKLRAEYVAWTMLAVSVSIIVYLLVQVGLPFGSPIEQWTMQFNDGRRLLVNTHMVVNLYWNLTFIFCVYTLTLRRLHCAIRVLTFLFLLPVLGALFITEGRTGLLTTCGICLSFMLYAIYRARKWWMAIFVLLFAGGMYATLQHRERFIAAVTKINPRVYIWNIAKQQIAEKPILGYGVCSARAEFIKRGMDDEVFYNNYAHALLQEQEKLYGHSCTGVMHPHNMFLETWTQFGIIGLLVLAACLLLPFVMHIGKEQLYADLCVFAFAMQGCFESIGNHLPPMFLCLMVFIWERQYLSHSQSTSAQPTPKELP